MQRLELPRDNALVAVVVASPQHAALYAELRQTWTKLRILRAVLSEIESSASVPPPHFGHWQALEPADERVGYPIDRALVTAWMKALDALHEDPDAPLPGD